MVIPEPVKAKLLSMVSKKATVTLVGLLTVILNGKLGLGLDQASIVSISSIVVAYVGFQMHHDIEKIKSKGV